MPHTQDGQIVKDTPITIEFNDYVDDPTRRDFIALSVAAGLAAAAGPVRAGALPGVESDVTIKTPDGTCDAAFIHPAAGVHPGVLVWTDAFGLRPVMRDIGRRIAADG